MDQGERVLFNFKELVSCLLKQTKAEEKWINIWGKDEEKSNTRRKKGSKSKKILFTKQDTKSIWDLRPSEDYEVRYI